MSKILIIEDDSNILRLERDYLEANGFETEFALDGKTGVEKALGGNFSLVLLDIMLPELDGFQVCKAIRDEKDIPILLVSAKKEDLDKINGLGFGADDYIVKPFSPGELVARVKAHIARYQRLTNTAPKNDSILEIDGMKLDKESGDVTLNGVQISLTKKEFDVLYLLASNPDTVFGKNELFEKVWGYDSFGDTSTLTVHINRLRDKLRETEPNTDYIKTIWGRGYRFK
ncbi:MAG: response regulator transcription factor [Eubacterium sp.]|nr:response regulator transcription factor [Eubacterium sp.]